MARNPAAPLKPVKIKQTPTMPLSDEEYAKVLNASSERGLLLIEVAPSFRFADQRCSYFGAIRGWMDTTGCYCTRKRQALRCTCVAF